MITRNAANFRPWSALALRLPMSTGSMKTTHYRTAVVAFKRELIGRTLAAHGGNRTHAARALGLPRTYLVRLIRALDVNAAGLGPRDQPRIVP